MNLLDTASLVVTPNGYKASKLYSIIPSDGSGDMTFARTGDTATRVNSSGLIETVLANKPRLDYLGGGCPKLLLEPQRTNIFERSSEFDNAYWAKTNITITANSSVSPDGTSNADTINMANTGSNILKKYPITVSVSTTYTCSIFVKKDNYRYVGMRFIYYTTNNMNFYDFDTNTVNNTAFPSYPIKVENYANGWVRLSITATTSGSSTAEIFELAYVNSSGSSTATALGTEKYLVYGAQVEAGAYATSYIPTTTASVTRNGDSCVKTTITSLLGQTEGTIFADINFNKASVAFIDFVSMAGTNVVEIQYSNSDGKIYFVYYQAGDLCRIPSTTTIVKGNRYKLAGAYKNNDFIFYINGVQQGTDTSGTITGSLTNFGINGGYSPSQGNNEIVELNSAAHWKTRLQNSELATLTSL